MSDTESSGAATPAAETANTPSPQPNPTKPPSAFSNSRGSGLARGKRPVSPPAQAAPAAPAADYRPTAVSILTTPSEYKNPFAPSAPAATPTDATSPEAGAPTPAPAPAPAAQTAEVSAAPAAPTAEARPASTEPAPPHPVEAEPKPELNILPPEAPKRIEHSWESDSFRNVARQAADEPNRGAEAPPTGAGPRRDDRRGERPYFRPERERRDDRFAGSRGTQGVSGRVPGGDVTPRETPPPAPAEAPKKSGGWFGWVKKLFGSTGEKSESERDASGQREFGHEGHHHRRRRRGGRGRHFHGDQRGPRDGQAGGQPPGEPRGFGGEYRHHGRRRRRHHGGGDYRGGGRPEGGPPPGS